MAVCFMRLQSRRNNLFWSLQPQFVSLASTWEALEVQAVVVSKAANLHQRLQAYTRVRETPDSLKILLRRYVSENRPVECQGVRTVEAAVVDGILEGDSGGPPLTDAERVSAELPTAPHYPDKLDKLDKQLEAARRRLARDMGRGDVAAEVRKGPQHWHGKHRQRHCHL